MEATMTHSRLITLQAKLLVFEQRRVELETELAWVGQQIAQAREALVEAEAADEVPAEPVSE